MVYLKLDIFIILGKYLEKKFYVYGFQVEEEFLDQIKVNFYFEFKKIFGNIREKERVLEFYGRCQLRVLKIESLRQVILINLIGRQLVYCGLMQQVIDIDGSLVKMSFLWRVNVIKKRIIVKDENEY